MEAQRLSSLIKVLLRMYGEKDISVDVYDDPEKNCVNIAITKTVSIPQYSLFQDPIQTPLVLIDALEPILKNFRTQHE
jgi:hypothetical protein